MCAQSQISKMVATVILVYGDDSADAKKQRVSAVAIVIGSEKCWSHLEADWIHRCGGIPFHANDCESDQGDYRLTSHAENKCLYRDLTTLLVNSGLGGFGVAIDLVAQRESFPGPMNFAYFRSFVEVLDRVYKFAKHVGDVAKVTFDISTENEYNAGYLYKMLRDSEPEWARCFDHEISFAPAKEHARLQVADLLAFEAMKALDHTVGTIKRERRSWNALRETKRFDVWGYSHEWFKDLKAHYPEVQTNSGLSRQEYIDWLATTNRQHNISNMFEFWNWRVRQIPKG